MARRKRNSKVRLLIALVVLLAVAAVLWAKRDAVSPWLTRIVGEKSAITATHETTPAEGQPLRLSGDLASSGPARDSQLGVSANAAVLLRHVEMYQWQEHCEADRCRYDKAWSGPVDSHKFRDTHGHDNPPAPFNDAVFFAPGLKLDGHAVDSDLLIAQLPASNYAAHDASLPPNLAASFGEHDGVLYAGGDAEHPAIGAVRISYRVIAKEGVKLNGVQRSGKLSAH
jgi:hypothetical protein